VLETGRVGSPRQRAVLAPAILATTALLVSAVASAGAGGTHGNAVYNAGIAFTCPNAICIVRPDGSGRNVFVTAWFDSWGDPSWTRDGTALAYDVGYGDTHRIAVFFQVSTRRYDELGHRDTRSYEPSWSPDGRRIAMTEVWGGYSVLAKSTIKIISVATTKYAAVTKPRRRDHLTVPQAAERAEVRDDDRGVLERRRRRRASSAGRRSPTSGSG
jgi:hypothetical protein